uniref:Condensin-2 complex subunit H2 C-terminal domain-containing protein n=1 Tax=Glossina brevipalpis TaxID=37001 RepID=A0A1A9WGY1_9MUSC
MADEFTEILRAADKHPNSRISKLIRTIQEEPCQKNIVLLLVDLAEHTEYSIDFGISLKYYINLFEEMGLNHDMILNEAGLLLIHSSKIYSKRVEHVFALVERQILSLSKADKEMEKKKKQEEEKENSSNRGEINELDSGLERKRRGRKRALDDNPDPYEIRLIPKKIRKLNADKRFNLLQISATSKVSPISRSRLENDQDLHPACWLYGTIYDLENEEEFDSKRNYKLFTYHVEHRYNTLVPDINFRLHFKVKDFIEAEEDERLEMGNEDGRDWPPLSRAYVQKYIDLENRILDREKPVQTSQTSTNFDVIKQDKESAITTAATDNTITFGQISRVSTNENSIIKTNESESHDPSSLANDSDINKTSQISETLNDSCEYSATENGMLTQNSTLNDTSKNVLESTMEKSSLQETVDKPNESTLISMSSDTNLNDTSIVGGNQSQSQLSETSNREDGPQNNSIVDDSEVSKKVEGQEQDKNAFSPDEQNVPENAAGNQNLENDDCKINLSEIRIHLPHHDDEGVYFSDLDENEQRMLSPKVIANDIFPLIPNKENITIVIDDEIRFLLNLGDDQSEAPHLPITVKPTEPQLHFNIFKIPEKYFRKKVLFKLGTDMDLFMKTRLLIKARGSHERIRSKFPLNNTGLSGICTTRMDSPALSDFLGFSDDEDFLGFDDNENEVDQERRLTPDSGVDIAAANVNNKKSQNGNECKDNETTQCKDHENFSRNRLEIMENVTTTGAESLNGTLGANIEEQMKAIESQTTVDATNLGNSEQIDDNTQLMNATLSDQEDFIDIEVPSGKTKIQQWHDNLRPILAKSRDRHHFDVFQLGTEIIETIQSREADETFEDAESSYRSSSSLKSATFMDIMREKDKSYVSRYFLSTLLLVNQNNIELSLKNKSSEKPTHWNDLYMKLKSTKRYTVAMEDNIGMITTGNTDANESLNDTKNAATSTSIEKNNKESQERKPQKRISNGDKMSYSKMRNLQRLEKDSLEELNSSPTSYTDFDYFKEPANAMRTKSSNGLIASTPLDKRKANFQPDETRTPSKKPFLSETTMLSSSSSLTCTTHTPSNNSRFSTNITPARQTKFNNSSNIILPHLEANLNNFLYSSEQPTTSQQAKRMQNLQYNSETTTKMSPVLLLNSIKTLKPIQKAPQQSDDYDSGIYSNDDNLAPVLSTKIS